MAALSPAQQRVLAAIGWAGIEPERLSRDGREFGHLEREGLVVFWSIGGQRPESAYGGAITPGRWYLTAAGAEAIGLTNHPLRFA
jgi:hypothetical protein